MKGKQWKNAWRQHGSGPFKEWVRGQSEEATAYLARKREGKKKAGRKTNLEAKTFNRVGRYLENRFPRPPKHGLAGALGQKSQKGAEA